MIRVAARPPLTSLRAFRSFADAFFRFAGFFFFLAMHALRAPQIVVVHPLLSSATRVPHYNRLVTRRIALLLLALLIATPVPAQTPSSEGVASVQKAVLRALNFGQGDLERLSDARPDFTPAGWAAFLKHLEGFLDAGGAPMYTSSFTPTGEARIVSQADGALDLVIPGTLKQTQNTSSTTYPIVVQVKARGKPLKIDHLKQTICGKPPVSTPCQ